MQRKFMIEIDERELSLLIDVLRGTIAVEESDDVFEIDWDRIKHMEQLKKGFETTRGDHSTRKAIIDI